jgi:hypothetical protein
MRIILILTSLLTTLLLATPALADAKEIKLHQGLGEQNRVGKLFWRGGVELNFEDSRFGGVSAMQIERGGRTAYLMTDQGHLAEVTLEYNTAGNLSGARLAGIRDIIGAGGRGISSAIEAVARMPDGARSNLCKPCPDCSTHRSAWSGRAPDAASKPPVRRRIVKSCSSLKTCPPHVASPSPGWEMGLAGRR